MDWHVGFSSREKLVRFNNNRGTRKGYCLHLHSGEQAITTLTTGARLRGFGNGLVLFRS